MFSISVTNHSNSKSHTKPKVFTCVCMFCCYRSQIEIRGMTTGAISVSCYCYWAKMLLREWDHCLFCHWNMQTDSFLLYCFTLALLLVHSCLREWKVLSHRHLFAVKLSLYWQDARWPGHSCLSWTESNYCCVKRSEWILSSVYNLYTQYTVWPKQTNKQTKNK